MKKKPLLVLLILLFTHAGLDVFAAKLVHYSFDGSVADPAQLTVDSSGNGYVATVVKGSPAGSWAVPSALNGGNSWDSPGSNDAWMDMNVPAPSGNYSIAFWAKPVGSATRMIASSVGGSGLVVSQRITGTGEDSIRLEHNGSTVIDENDAGLVLYQSAWTHVAITVDISAGTAVLYVNGAVRFSATGLSLAPLDDGLERIGGNTSGQTTRGYNGQLDELIFYDHALTAEEVEGLVFLGDPPPLPQSNSLWLHYTFDNSYFDVSQLPVDSSGNGYDGILTGIDTGSLNVPISLFGGNSWDISREGHINVNPYLPVPSGNYTIAFWAKPAGSSTRFIATSMPDESNGLVLTQRGDDSLRYVHNGQQVIPETLTGVVLSQTNWTHVAVSIDVSAGNVALYVNGTERYVTNGLTLAPLTDGLERIGGRYDANTVRGFKGWLDDFRFYDYALTQSEVEVLVGDNSTGTVTFVMQPPDGTKIPKILGAGADPVPETGYDYIDWFGVTHHRTWFRPWLPTLPDNSSVTSAAAFDAATAAIRQDPLRQATSSDYYIDWDSYLGDLDSQLDGGKELERVVSLGIEPMVQHSTFVDDVNSITGDWEKMFQYWKSWYAMVYYMASNYDVTKYQVRNEPHAAVTYDAWESHWLVAVDAMRKAMQDVNEDYGKSLTVVHCGPVETGPVWDYSVTDPDLNHDGWGNVSWKKVKYDIYGNYNVNNPWNYDMYDFHRYMDGGDLLQERVMHARNSIANAHNDPRSDIPIVLTELNTRAGGKFDEIEKDSEDVDFGLRMARIMQCLPALGPNGLGDEGGFYIFKIGASVSDPTPLTGIKNSLSYTSTVAPNNRGGVTRGGACFQLYSKHFNGGKSIVPYTVPTGGSTEHRLIAVVDPDKNQYYLYGSNFTGSEPDVVIDLSALDVSAGQSVTIQRVDENNTGQITERLIVDGSKQLHLSVPDISAYLITVPKSTSVVTETVVSPSEDTMQNVADTVVHGAETTMRVSNDHNTPAERRAAFMRYHVNNVDTMDRALLRVSGRNIGVDQNLREIVHVYAVANENWSEDSSMSWASAPGVGKYYIDETTVGTSDGLGDMIDIEDNYAGVSGGVGTGLGIYGQFIGALSFYSNSYTTNYLDVTDYLKSVANGSGADVTFAVVRIVRYNVNYYDNTTLGGGYYTQGVYHYDGRIVELASKENSNSSLRPAIIVMGGTGDGNWSPTFSSDPINKANATEGFAYNGSIANDASDPESDPMTFSKVSGPAWLSVSAGGALSGTPGTSDMGLNSFTVQVDAEGGSDTAILQIMVLEVGGTLVELFADGFEDGFSPIWNSTAYLSGASYEGTNSAKMNNSDSVETSIDTTGYSGILVTYSRKTDALQSGSSFVSEWYDGTSWNTIEEITSGFTNHELVSQVALPSGADNNSNFRLRFRVNAGTDYAIVDAVVVEGVSIGGLVGYDLWASTYGVGGPGTETNDFDSDGKNNFYEYVMVGDPTDAQDLGKPVEFIKNGNEFIYVHPQNLDDSSLIYTVESTSNLFDPNSWATGVYTVSGTNLIDGMGYVSNVINFTEDKVFIRTKVEKQ